MTKGSELVSIGHSLPSSFPSREIIQFILKFLKDLPVQPYKIHGNLELSETDKSNCEYHEVGNATTQDLRDCLYLGCLGKEGSKVIKSPSRCVLSAEVFERENPESNEIIVVYLKETMNSVWKRFNASFVVTVD